MKHLVTMVVSVLILASCSTPKYTYNFDYYDYNSGRKKAEAERLVATTEPSSAEARAIETKNAEASPLLLSNENIVASVNETTPAPVAKTNTKKYADMSKSEKKELRKAVKTEIKNYLKNKKGDGPISKETKALDYNLKMAIIFGA
ncbi:MAG TPA: hypothetical protein VGD31_15885, partial [Sphingobacteriaceae bacterium]